MQTLIVHYPNGREDNFPLSKPQMIVGSSRDCDIVVTADGMASSQLTIFVSHDVVEIVNLQQPKSALLNDVPCQSRSRLMLGDVLRIGDVTLKLRVPAVALSDGAKSPDDSRFVWSSVRRLGRIGWRGYRNIVEVLSGFISPDEADEASRAYRGGSRALLISALVLVVGAFASSFMNIRQLFVAEEIIDNAMTGWLYLAVLFLAGRYKVSFAGRLMFPMFMVFSQSGSPNIGFSDFFKDVGIGWGIILGIALIVGWLLDYGAGMTLAGKRAMWRRYVAWLIGISITPALGVLLEYTGTPSAISSWWGFIPSALCAALCWPIRLFAFRRRITPDALFTAEVASRRASRRVLWQIVAVALLVFPVLTILSLLGDAERRAWPESNLDDYVWTDESTKDEAWFWEDRGRYLLKKDFASPDHTIYQVPDEILTVAATMEESTNYWERLEDGTTSVELFWNILEDKKYCFLTTHPKPASTNELDSWREAYHNSLNCFILSDFATNLCAHIDLVQANCESNVFFEALCGVLEPYRMTSSDAEVFAQNTTQTVTVVCERIPRRPEFGNLSPHIFGARMQIGVKSVTRENLEERQKEGASQIKIAGVSLIFVLSLLGFLILWRRGADSRVGFWLGIAMLGNATLACGFLNGESVSFMPVYLQYAIWRQSFDFPLASIVAHWVALLNAMNWAFALISPLSQTMLMVYLCWPDTDGKPRSKGCRFFRFVGKAIILLLPGVLPGALVGMVFGLTGNQSMAAGRLACIPILAFVGFLLRRKRRAFTEVQRLGLAFFLGWLAIDIAMQMLVDFQSDDSATGIFATFFNSDYIIFGRSFMVGPALVAILPIISVVCWFWLFVKERFLNVLGVGSLSLAVFAFIIPVASRVMTSELVKRFSDNIFISRVGNQIISVLVVAALFPTVLKWVLKLIRWLFQRETIRMEKRMATALETIEDETDNRSARIFAVLSCMDIAAFTFYERTASNEFQMRVSKNCDGDANPKLQVSIPLKKWLGAGVGLLDFEDVPGRDDLFFHSFELWGIYKQTLGRWMLPICLGTSVRGLLFVRLSYDGQSALSGREMLENVNELGLAATDSFSVGEESQLNPRN